MPVFKRYFSPNFEKKKKVKKTNKIPSFSLYWNAIKSCINPKTL